MPRRALVVAAVLVLATASVAAPAAAAETDDGSLFDGLLEDQGDDGAGDLSTEIRQALLQAINLDRLVKKYTTDPGEASTYAEEFQAEFNANNESIEAFVNERINASESVDVVAIHFHDRQGGNATRYLVANATNGSYQNARIVDPSTFDALNRTVDEQIWADWYVSRHAAGELESFVATYVEPGKDVPWTYRSTMLAKYGSGLRGTLWSDLNGSETDG